MLFISSHQYPYWPGTGAADERGDGAGVGFTLNLPLPAGSTDSDYEAVYRQQVIPALDAFSPSLLVPAHCTGWRAVHRLAARFPHAFVMSTVGTTITL